MHNNGKINRGMDLGTTNSALAIMENGAPVIKKTSTQKDTMPSIVSVNRRRAVHVGDMAANGAYSGAVLIGWGIAGIGMLALSLCFFGLNKVRPDLTNGVYSYAKEGFGEYVGFNSAWGYWISALLCNVSYTTLLFGSIGFFFPVFGEGNNLLSVICASAVIWFFCYLVLRGVKEAA